MNVYRLSYQRLLGVWATLVLLLGGYSFAMAQNESTSSPTSSVRSLDPAQWETLQNKLDYRPQEEEKEEEKPVEKEEAKRWDWPDLGDWSPFAKILAMTILVGLLSWVTLQIIVNYQTSQNLPETTTILTKDTSATLQRIEEQLDRTEVLPLLQRTELEGNYLLAVRLYYLEVLKRLNEQGHIKWKKDATNRAYLRVLRSTPYATTFLTLTQTFERIWYGNNAPTASRYQEIKQQFEDFLSSLKQENPGADA